MLDFLPIQTTRLILRRFGPGDLRPFQSYRSDPVLARFQGWQPVADDEASSFLSAQAQQQLGKEGEWLQVAIVSRDSSEVVGDLGLCVVDEVEGRVHLGFTLARPAQGHGYATEAVAGVLAALLDQGRAQAVEAITDSRNTRSVALLKRLGFRHAGTAARVFRNEACEEHTFVLRANERSGA